MKNTLACSYKRMPNANKRENKNIKMIGQMLEQKVTQPN